MADWLHVHHRTPNLTLQHVTRPTLAVQQSEQTTVNVCRLLARATPLTTAADLFHTSHCLVCVSPYALELPI